MDDPRALRAAVLEGLPGWVTWAGPVAWTLGALVLGFAAAWVTVWVARLRVGRVRDAHWTERARVLWPGTIVAATAPLIVALCCAIAASKLDGSLVVCPSALVLGSAALAGYLGAALAAGVHAMRISTDRLTWKDLCSAEVVRHGLLFPSLPVTALTLIAIPREWGWTAFVCVLGGCGVMAWLLFGGCARVLLAAGVASPADEALERLAAGAATAAGIATPRSYWVETPMANAAVLLLPHILFVTRPAARLLSDEELRAVLDHEMGHLAEPRRVAIAHAVRAVLLIPVAAAVPLYHSYGWPHAVALFLACVLAMRLSQRLPRRMEERADARAMCHEHDDGVYARALEKIYEHNLVPAVLRSKRLPHPDLYDRLEAAGVTPAYPRPAPPPRLPRFLGLCVMGVLLVCVGVALGIGRDVALARVSRDPGAQALALALTGGSPWALMGRARTDIEHGATERAAAAVHLVAGYADGDVWLLRELAAVEALLGHADHARGRLDQFAVAFAGKVRQSPWLACDAAELLHELGEYERARAWLETAETLRRQRHPHDADLLCRFGRLRAAWGEPEAAELHLDLAIRLDRGKDPWLAVRLASLSRDVGRVELADSYEARARQIAAESGRLEEVERYITGEQAARADR